MNKSKYVPNADLNFEKRSHNEIESINEFLEVMQSNINEEDEFYFRGHSDLTYKPIPSIFRKKSWIENENKMFRELILRCPNEFINLHSTFQKLVKMQHYGLPTRLLDITSNPLIALYFACCSHQEQDGEVVVFKVPKHDIKYYDSDTVAIISNLAKLARDFNIKEIISLTPKDFSLQENVSLLLHEIGQEKTGFLPKIKPQDLQSVVCVKPLLENSRIIKQEGAFLLFGMKDLIIEPQDLKDYLYSIKNHHSSRIIIDDVNKLIITHSAKQKILSQLKVLGIHEGTVYPEIGNVAEAIKKQFS